MKSPAHGFTAQTVLMAAAFGLSLSGPHRASAAPVAPIANNDSGIAVTILSPVPRASFSGIKPVEISAFYQGSAANQIVNIELYVDGNKAAQKVLDAPEMRGVVSFLIDASALTAGQHRIVVRATGADAEVTSAHSSFVYEMPMPETSPENAPETTPTPTVQPAAIRSEGAPTLSIVPPAGGEDNSVQGTVKVRIRATDPSGKPPYVSIFVDRQFKTLRNYAPYEFDWDTTAYSNGYHTVEAFGYNDAQAVGHAQAMRFLVNNPGGRTGRRTDLLDAPAAPVKKADRAYTGAGRKAAAIARRPDGAMLAAPKATTVAMASRQPRRLQMAQVFAIIQRSARLSEMPALPMPFVGDTAVQTPKATLKALALHPATPVRHFKPITRTLATEAGEALLAITSTARPAARSTAHIMRLSKAMMPGEEFSSDFMLSPTMPKVKATLAAHTTLAFSPGKAMRLISHAPHAAQHVNIHLPRMASQIEWLRAVGQKTLMFNSTRLPLERPLAAHHSIMFGPLRQIFEQGGGSLLWQARTGVVQARSKDKNVSITIGRKQGLVNNAIVMLDGKPYINNGRTMIPLSFLKQAMNVDVQYDEASGHLTITSKN